MIIKQSKQNFENMKNKSKVGEDQIIAGETPPSLSLAEEKSSETSRRQIIELKEGINDLTEKLRLVNIHQKNLEDER